MEGMNWSCVFVYPSHRPPHISVPSKPAAVHQQFFQDHLDPDFIDERRVGLQLFLRSLVKVS